MGEVTHRASIAITKLKMGGRIPDEAQALLDWIADLQRELDEDGAEISRLRKVEEAAWDAVDYHRLGYSSDEPWDADHMLTLMNNLGDRLS